jgi:hypothetical protein
LERFFDAADRSAAMKEQDRLCISEKVNAENAHREKKVARSGSGAGRRVQAVGKIFTWLLGGFAQFARENADIRAVIFHPSEDAAAAAHRVLAR